MSNNYSANYLMEFLEFQKETRKLSDSENDVFLRAVRLHPKAKQDIVTAICEVYNCTLDDLDDFKQKQNALPRQREEQEDGVKSDDHDQKDLLTPGELGVFLKYMKNNEGLSIEELAGRLEVKPMTLRKWLRGNGHYLRQSTIEKVCNVFDVTHEDIIHVIEKNKLSLGKDIIFPPENLAAFTRSARLQSCMTCEDFAAENGVLRSQLTKIEKGEVRAIARDFASALCGIFNGTVEDINNFDPKNEISLTKEKISEFLKDQIDDKQVIAVSRKMNLPVASFRSYRQGKTFPHMSKLKTICEYFNSTPFDIANYGVRPEKQIPWPGRAPKAA